MLCGTNNERVTEDIRAVFEEANSCILCSRIGTPAYVGLRDYTFGTAGQWHYRECRPCGLLWLSPRPVLSSMGQFYTNYLTHGPKTDHASARRVYDRFKLALWRRALRQERSDQDWWWDQIVRVASADPFVREIGQMGTMYLGASKPGKLLDVGCGNGSFLSLMRSAGWDVSGIEPDPKAADLARQRLGIPIRGGELFEAGFGAGSFDAVTLQHVIEHVHDPIGVLSECRRILKPKGQLVIVTPNLQSVGHKWFRSDWRGLEPPRHLHIFSSRALERAVEMAGMRIELHRTSGRAGAFIWLESQAISKTRLGKGKRRASLTAASAFLAWERIVNALYPGTGEELVFAASPTT